MLILDNLRWNQEETLDDFTDNGVDDLVVSLYQMDLDRTLFLLRSYLRLRLQKVRLNSVFAPHSSSITDQKSQNSHWHQMM
jgi:GINS complex subunit 4